MNAATSTASPAPLVVDTRPVFGQGSTPCGAIDDAVRQLKPGQLLVMLVPFEPVPLYTKLGNLGFEHRAVELEDGTWRVEFKRTGGPTDLPLKIPRCDCSGKA
jgi:uncharacterized protein (DUF2249 family)